MWQWYAVQAHRLEQLNQCVVLKIDIASLKLALGQLIGPFDVKLASTITKGCSSVLCR